MNVTRPLFYVVLLTLLGSSALAQDNEAAPAPPSIGTDIPLTYFGPTPSGALLDPRDRALVGEVQLLRAATLDLEAGTMTLPLYRGQMKDGTPVWYILTDTTDKANADALGLNHSGKLTYADVPGATRVATLGNDLSLTFESGTVDFSPERVLLPGPAEAPFPPSVAEPGSVGDEAYSPLVRLQNAGNHIYNAPVLAYGVEAEAINFCEGSPDYSLVHDKVLSICPEDMTVTLQLVPGFSFARPIMYVSFDASDPVAAVLEASTYAPALANIQVGFDDGAFSAIERLFVTVNGPTGANNPQRQGLNSLLLEEGNGPLNLFGGVPTIALDYSPLWDMNLGEWTDEAIANGYRSRMIDEFQYLGMAEQGWITAPDGEPFGSSGIIINCPVVFRFL
jgi:hypothetical protein